MFRSTSILPDNENNNKVSDCFRVQLIGGSGVGKSSLCEKFLCPDYVYTYESLQGKGLSLSLSLSLFLSLSLSLSSCIVAGPSCDPSVCIMLEDIETELVFLDTAHTDLVSLEHMVSHHMMLLGYT